MEYNEFKKCVVESVKKELYGKEKVEIHSVLKNNAKQLDGLTVFREGHSIAPALCLNEYYQEYRQGCPLGNIVREITDFYKYGRDEAEGMDVAFFKEYAKVREHLYFKVVNYEKNVNNLQNLPHVRTMDLAIVFYCKMSHETMGDIMIQIYNSHIKLWNIQLADLYVEAMKNTVKKMPVEIRSMNEIIGEMLLQDAAELERKDIANVRVDDNMYVLTNYLRQYGAACMFYQGVLSKFAMTVGTDFYILPSSVHEVILLPVRKDYTKEKLQEMVRQVNRTQVAEEDVLSDNIYLYSKKMRKILF